MAAVQCYSYPPLVSTAPRSLVATTTMSVIIYPTHECFDDAVEFVEEVIGDALRIPEVCAAFMIVHAVLVTPSGKRFAHAWCEEAQSGHVWQRGVIPDQGPVWYAHDVAAYRAVMTVERETRYTIRQWSELNKHTGHYGPWRREYIELARNGEAGAVLHALHGSLPIVAMVVAK